MGQIARCSIYRVDKLLFVPIGQPDKEGAVSKRDQDYIDMILNIAKEKNFFFSYDLNISQPVQRIISSIAKPPTDQTQDFWKGYDKRFVFNINMLQNLAREEMRDFLVPCMFGYVFI